MRQGPYSSLFKDTEEFVLLYKQINDITAKLRPNLVIRYPKIVFEHFFIF